MPRDYHARLVVYGISKLTSRNVKNLCIWLRNLADDIEKSPKEYSTTAFVARLMK